MNVDENPLVLVRVNKDMLVSRCPNPNQEPASPLDGFQFRWLKIISYIYKLSALNYDFFELHGQVFKGFWGAIEFTRDSNCLESKFSYFFLSTSFTSFKILRILNILAARKLVLLVGLPIVVHCNISRSKL